MNENFKIPIVKHLEDMDDLTLNRDAGLIENQEQLASKIAFTIYNHAMATGVSILYFGISPKKRAIQTAQLVINELKSMPKALKIISRVENNLREIDQGSFILPAAYEPRDNFNGLKIAGKIFISETFNPMNSLNDNLNYHFGDPLIQSDGTYKYPQLVEYFEKSGESYKDVLLRLYTQVVTLADNLVKFTNRAQPVIFTHGQPHQIFTNLSQVAQLIQSGNLKFKTGELPRVCWDLYTQGRKNVIPFDQVAYVSIEDICKPEMIQILKNEIDFLKKGAN